MTTLNLTLKEAFMIGTVIVSVTTSYVLLQQDVKQLKEDVKDIRNEIDSMHATLNKQTVVANFLIGESVKYGWIIPDKWFDSVKDQPDKKLWQRKDEVVTTE